MAEVYKFTHELLDNTPQEAWMIPKDCDSCDGYGPICEFFQQNYGLCDVNMGRTSFTMVAWIYERLKTMFDLKCAASYLPDDVVNIDGVEVSYKDCLERMIVDCEVVLHLYLADDHPKVDVAMRDLFKLLSATFWLLG